MCPEHTIDVQTIGGRQLAHVFAPDGPPAAVLAVLPALGIRAAYYRCFASEMAARGICTVLADWPGHGDSGLRAHPLGRQWGYPELVDQHARGVCEAAMQHVPGVPFSWIGHSIGGQVCLMHAGRNRSSVAAVVVIASGSPHFRSWPGVDGWKVRGSALLAAAISRSTGFFPGDKLGFGGRESGRLMRQWAGVVRSGEFRFDAFDGEGALAAWDGKTFACRLQGDDWAPERSLETLLARIADASVERWLWPVADGINHNNWPRDPVPAADKIAPWLKAAVHHEASNLRSGADQQGR